MFKLRHPLSQAVYAYEGDDRVRVEAKDGTSGLFDEHGAWIEGDLKTADPEMCRWVISKDQLARRSATAGIGSRDRQAAFQEVGFDRLVGSIKKGEQPA